MTSLPETESGAFRAFEHDGWESIPAQYDGAFSGLTSQAAEPLLDAAGVAAGMDVLDVASGPGHVAAAAVSRGARVVGVDFSETMVERARQLHPTVAFQVGDAEALPLADAGFDAVVMNFGLLHLARPEEALREAFRVLRSGGRFAFTVWAPPERAAGFAVVLHAVEAHGTLDVPLPPGPPFFRFSDPRESTRALTEAGFSEVRTAIVPLTWRLAFPDALFECMRDGTVRTGGLIRAQTPEAQSRIRTAMRETTLPYRTNDGIELPMPALLASGLRP